MVLYLASSLKLLDYSIDKNLYALECISHGYTDGNHIILGKRDTFEFLSKITGLGKISVAVYKKLMSLQTQYGLFKSEVEIYLNITDTKVINENNNHIDIPLEYFSKISSVKPINLLCENTNDIYFFKKISECYIKRKRYKIKLEYNPQLGGGSTTALVYNHNQTTNSICLTILDSDKYYETDSYKNTAKDVLKIDDSNRPLSKIFILPVREVENLITAKIISNMIDGNREYCDMTESVKALEIVEKKGLYNELKYIDFKKGLTYLDHLNYLSKHNVDISNICSFPVNQVCKTNNSCKDIPNCSCFLVKGFGENILTIVTSHMEGLSCNTLSEMAHDEIIGKWDELSSKIVTWCCSLPRSIT